MKKKAASEMWWIVIGAVIALVVLIVLMLIFTTKSNTLETGLLECGSKGGECLPADQCLNQDGSKGTVSTAFECAGAAGENVCCFKNK